MGKPASKIEAAWRNHVDEVAKFLKTYHGGKYLVINLTEKHYDYSKFEEGRVSSQS